MMVKTIKRFQFSLLLVSSLLLAACSSVPDAHTVRMDTFPRGDAEEVLAAGFGHIMDKYIEDTSLQTLAIEGIKGLSSIDTSISIEHDNKNIILKRSWEAVASFPAPQADDIEGWAYTTALVLAESRKYSTDLMDASEEELYEVVFDGALSTLDIYSRYAGYSEADNNRAKRDGFGGIGIYFDIDDDKVMISKVMTETPAQIAGIHPNDQILAIEGFPVSNMKATEIVKRLRGPIGSHVNLRVDCIELGIVNFKLERRHIVPETVTAKIKNDILQLKVNSFNHGTANSVASELEKAFVSTGQALKGVILDLRGNPGGLLRQSVQLADTFLTKGNILDTKGRHTDSLQHYEASGADMAKGLPMVVLVDGNSASASEIVAAALQDTERAVILGTTSYGKGTVQTVIRLPNNGELTLTWSRFMAPSGYALQGLGVSPVICTSGVTTSPSMELLNTLENQSVKRDTLSLWRQVALNNTTGRNKLRSQCPPEKHTTNKDLKLAQMLLEDDVLYSRALNLITTTAEAFQ